MKKNTVTTASGPTAALMTTLDTELKKIPNIKKLSADKYTILVNSLRDVFGFRLADVDWVYGKAGKRPGVAEPVLMHDIENAFRDASIPVTVWNDLDISGNECDLFKVYRCIHEQITGGGAPLNLKHIHKNSKNIK